MEQITCKFDSNSCSLTCNKYAMCSYYATQNQMSNIQSQLNFIYKTIGEILESSKEAEVKVKLLEDALFKFCSRDSEAIETNN